MLIELLDLLIGIVFGFFHKGKEDYMGLIRNGAITGLVTGIIFVLVSIFIAPDSMSVSLGYLGAIGFLIEILIFVVIFIAGTFIGDCIERALKK